MRMLPITTSLSVLLMACMTALAQVAVRGKTVYTMAGEPIANGVVIIENGKISAVGKAGDVAVPTGMQTLQAEIVIPGLIDAHSTVGLSGILNYAHDQEQFDRSAPIQPELRAIDAFNIRDPLVEWVRGFGVTTVHTGHAPGELISGQTIVVKTAGDTVEDALLVARAAVAATIGHGARKGDKKSPGTRGKMIAMLREQFIKADEYRTKIKTADADKKPSRDLALETLVAILDGEVPLLVTVQRAQDISSALRLQREFGFKMILDGAAEGYLLIDDIKRAGTPVIVHPTMMRAVRETQNASFETAAKLHDAGIPIAMQTGYEDYVPKTRVVLFEAAIAAANGLSFDDTLATITIDAARILGVQDRVGSIEVGKDGDVALYDGDPFEYTTHCVGVIINGNLVSAQAQ